LLISDKDSDCIDGLLCADKHKSELTALGYDPRKAYCGKNAGAWNFEVCYDPKNLAKQPVAAPVKPPVKASVPAPVRQAPVPRDAKKPTDIKKPTDNKKPADNKKKNDNKLPMDNKKPTDDKNPTDKKVTQG
jgi:hypothetical protein